MLDEDQFNLVNTNRGLHHCYHKHLMQVAAPVASKSKCLRLDLETGIPIEQRLTELKKFNTDKVAVQMQCMNTESDLLSDLKKRPHLKVTCSTQNIFTITAWPFKL
jgi:hypothetical protein